MSNPIFFRDSNGTTISGNKWFNDDGVRVTGGPADRNDTGTSPI